MTRDNVTLRIHRLWNPKVNGTEIPVIMLPAVVTDGDIFPMNGPPTKVTMMLANQGYEVFLANYRQSSYSSMTPEQLEHSTLVQELFENSASLALFLDFELPVKASPNPIVGPDAKPVLMKFLRVCSNSSQIGR